MIIVSYYSLDSDHFHDCGLGVENLRGSINCLWYPAICSGEHIAPWQGLSAFTAGLLCVSSPPISERHKTEGNLPQW